MSALTILVILACGAVTLMALIAAVYYHERYNDSLNAKRSDDELIEHLGLGVYRSSLDGKQISANKALVKLNGYSSEAEMLHAVTDIAIEWYVEPGRRDEFSRILDKHGVVSDFISEIYRHKTRERIWISENARLVRHHRTGKPLYFEGTVRDISDQIAKETTDKLLENLTEKSPHGLFRLVRHTDGTFTSPYASKRFYEMIDQEKDQEFDALAFDARVHDDDREQYRNSLRASRADMLPWKTEFRFLRADGSTDWCEISATPETGKYGEIVWHGYLSFITERKKAEDQIFKLAYFDPLTGLSNRTRFLQSAEETLEKAKRNRCFAALGFIDLDNFKILNDTRGHAFGDKLLIAVAHRLETTLPKAHLLSRFGGDEFVIMLPSLGRDLAKAQAKVERATQKLLKEIQRGFSIDEIECPMTLSMGISMYDPSKNLLIGDLLKSADVAMYEAKKSGRNRAIIHDVQMLERVTERYKLQHEIHLAIRDEQFELELQPQVHKSGKIVAAEALVRWNHPKFGRIMPSDFIVHAEQSGQIGILNEWVIKESIKLLATWQNRDDLANMRLYVNISPRQMIDAGFCDFVANALDQFDLKGSKLVIELTEDAMDRNPKVVKANMHRLQEFGISFALDNFGTGYSSISQLRQFPFNELKMDGSLVSDIASDDEAKSIAAAVINMAQALGLHTIAEHVTEYAQHEALSELGCDLYQGYLFYRPLKVSDFETIMVSNLTVDPDFVIDVKRQHYT